MYLIFPEEQFIEQIWLSNPFCGGNESVWIFCEQEFLLTGKRSNKLIE